MIRFILFLLVTVGIIYPLSAQEFYGMKVHKSQKLDYTLDSINWTLAENTPDPFNAISYNQTKKMLTYYIEFANQSDVDNLRNELHENFEYSGRIPEECQCHSATPRSGGDPDDACWCVPTFKYSFTGKKGMTVLLTFERRKGEVTIAFKNE